MSFQERKPVIAINTRHWIPGHMEGIGRYEMNMAVELSRLHPDVSFHWIFDRKPHVDLQIPANVTVHKAFPPARHPLLLTWWYEWTVPALLRKIKADVFLSADNINSLRSPCPTITVIHDIGFEHNPSDLPHRWARYYTEKTPGFIHAASKVVTVSEFSRQDIIQTYHTDADKIAVVGNGVADMFLPMPDEKISQIRTLLTGGRPYFFVLGSMHPRKNLKKTIEAYIQFRQGGEFDYPLVISGRPLWRDPFMNDLMQTGVFDKDIIFTGYLNDEAVAETMGASFALLFMSCWEGFGVPLIEAFACGVPVIASNATAIPEVVGDAALMAYPTSAGDIAAAMKRLVSDNNLQRELKEKGLLRAKKFSWTNSASDMWKVIESVLGQTK
jgi:glycosyltransferase involved in cell wall biosynthesis